MGSEICEGFAPRDEEELPTFMDLSKDWESCCRRDMSSLGSRQEPRLDPAVQILKAYTVT